MNAYACVCFLFALTCGSVSVYSLHPQAFVTARDQTGYPERTASTVTTVLLGCTIHIPPLLPLSGEREGAGERGCGLCHTVKQAPAVHGLDTEMSWMGHDFVPWLRNPWRRGGLWGRDSAQTTTFMPLCPLHLISLAVHSCGIWGGAGGGGGFMRSFAGNNATTTSKKISVRTA